MRLCLNPGVQCTMYRVYFTVYSVHCTPYTVHCTVYIVPPSVVLAPQHVFTDLSYVDPIGSKRLACSIHFYRVGRVLPFPRVIDLLRTCMVITSCLPHYSSFTPGKKNDLHSFEFI